MSTSAPMYLYHLMMTDEGRKISWLYEINNAMVVCAANSKQARSLAATMVIDEPEHTWTNGRYSTCRRIGEVTASANRRARVICADSNAS